MQVEIGVSEMGATMMRRQHATLGQVASMAQVGGHYERQAPPGMQITGEDPGTTAAPTAAPTPAPPTSSSAYMDAVLASDPVGYWSMGDVGGGKARGQGRACGQPGGLLFGDPCFVDGAILGSPQMRSGLVPSNTANQAMLFSGNDNEEVKIPDSHYINTNETGYDQRTVELWFESASIGGINRTIYCEGNEAHSGLSMYVKDDDMGDTRLYMFAWDRGNHENEFGTVLINPAPISCAIEKQKAYYVAMEFNAHNQSFMAWIKHPDSSELELCGITADLPVNVRLRHHGHGGGNAVIGGIHTSSRAAGDAQMVGSSHNFNGIIDEVAIYNRALPKAELIAHIEAASAVATTTKAAPAP